MTVCCDTSFLFSLYGNDVHTANVLENIKTLKQPIILSVFNEFELTNSLRFHEKIGSLGSGKATASIMAFETDIAAGKILVIASDLSEVIAKANYLSAKWTLNKGYRSFDILHVAAALVLKSDHFWTFDKAQAALAQAEGLAT